MSDIFLHINYLFSVLFRLWRLRMGLERSHLRIDPEWKTNKQTACEVEVSLAPPPNVSWASNSCWCQVENKWKRRSGGRISFGSCDATGLASGWFPLSLSLNSSWPVCWCFIEQRDLRSEHVNCLCVLSKSSSAAFPKERRIWFVFWQCSLHWVDHSIRPNCGTQKSLPISVSVSLKVKWSSWNWWFLELSYSSD